MISEWLWARTRHWRLATALIEAATENLEMNGRFDEPDEPYLRVVQ